MEAMEAAASSFGGRASVRKVKVFYALSNAARAHMNDLVNQVTKTLPKIGQNVEHNGHRYMVTDIGIDPSPRNIVVIAAINKLLKNGRPSASHVARKTVKAPLKEFLATVRPEAK